MRALERLPATNAVSPAGFALGCMIFHDIDQLRIYPNAAASSPTPPVNNLPGAIC
jgi:hypothetical protein